MSMGTSSTRRVETDALIMVVGCRKKRQKDETTERLDLGQRAQQNSKPKLLKLYDT